MSYESSFRLALENLGIDLVNIDRMIEMFNKTEISNIKWENVKPLINIPKLINLKEFNKNDLKRLSVLKLNGGLGTSLGCTGPKSLIEVHSGYSFLDLAVEQIRNVGFDVPLILMNSFNTYHETNEALWKGGDVRILSFMQRRFPRIWRDTRMPAPPSKHAKRKYWYPPGHGDVYPCLFSSGLIDSLLEEGRDILFISNIDNVGATPNIQILRHFINSKLDFLMEVKSKTSLDQKGGIVVQYGDKLKLIESIQIPKNQSSRFKNATIFNTNNLWVNLNSLKKRMIDGDIPLDVFQNIKFLGTRQVIQLERASGSAISIFEKSSCIIVDTQRFLPCKSTTDLFRLQSNLFKLKNGKIIIIDPNSPLPTIRLSKSFSTLSEFQRRIPEIPDISGLTLLIVEGSVEFNDNITLKGNVTIIADDSHTIFLPKNSFFENCVVRGRLKISDF